MVANDAAPPISIKLSSATSCVSWCVVWSSVFEYGGCQQAVAQSFSWHAVQESCWRCSKSCFQKKTVLPRMTASTGSNYGWGSISPMLSCPAACCTHILILGLTGVHFGIASIRAGYEDGLELHMRSIIDGLPSLIERNDTNCKFESCIQNLLVVGMCHKQQCTCTWSNLISLSVELSAADCILQTPPN